MKVCICLGIAFCAPLVGVSQAPDYWFTPDTVYHADLPMDSTVVIAQIDYGDLAAQDSVTWAWKRVEWDAPEGWTVDVCDPSVCHTGVPASATQLPLAADQPSFLKFLISSRGIPGQASGTFWAFPSGQIQHHLTLHFTFIAGVSSTPSDPASPAPTLHPNPTTGPLSWGTPAPATGTWLLLTSTGRPLRSGQLPTVPDLHGLPAGLYFVRTHPEAPLIRLVKSTAP